MTQHAFGFVESSEQESSNLDLLLDMKVGGRLLCTKLHVRKFALGANDILFLNETKKL